MNNHPKLFRYLIAVGVCYVITLITYFARVSDVLSELDAVQNPIPEPDLSKISTEKPLELGKHIDALPYATVKSRAEDIRRRYNRNVHICAEVRNHLKQLLANGYVGNGVSNSVERSLNVIERQNHLLKRQYDIIVAFAEKHYVQNLSKEHNVRTENDAHLLESQNEKLLQVVGAPLEL